MLIKDFYTVKQFSTGENKAEAVIQLNPEHNVYEGHFPGQPVVPGVIQLQILRELTEKALEQKLFISEVTSAKYLNMIVPDNNPLTVEFSYKTTDEGFSINGVLKNEDRIFSKVKMKVSKV
jgi:3-hydroxyacyl-[acyl-carrier-protein] dehydratase